MGQLVILLCLFKNVAVPEVRWELGVMGCVVSTIYERLFESFGEGFVLVLLCGGERLLDSVDEQKLMYVTVRVEVYKNAANAVLY